MQFLRKDPSIFDDSDTSDRIALDHPDCARIGKTMSCEKRSEDEEDEG